MDLTLGLAWFRNTVAGNEVWRFLAWLCVILVAFLAGRIARHYGKRVAVMMDHHHRDMVAIFLRAGSRSIVFVLVSIALKSGLHFLVMNDTVSAFTVTASNILMIVAITYVLYCLVDALCLMWAAKAARTPSKMDDMLVPIVRRTAQATLVVLGLVQVATVLSDKPLTSILAGLGVGGLAVALAAQETIKNFFGSMTVLTDKPFELGDRIIVDLKYDGVVESVGVRSTRIRTLEGSLISIPNGELASKVIENTGKRTFFRRLMDLQLASDTPPEKIEKALTILREILAGHPGMQPDTPPRAVFFDVGATSLTLRVFYWCHMTDYWAFMAFSESVNLQIMRRFKGEGIAFAFPSQALYWAGGVQPNEVVK
jgi:MscS family membrane protein